MRVEANIGSITSVENGKWGLLAGVLVSSGLRSNGLTVRSHIFRLDCRCP